MYHCRRHRHQCQNGDFFTQPSPPPLLQHSYSHTYSIESPAFTPHPLHSLRFIPKRALRFSKATGVVQRAQAEGSTDWRRVRKGWRWRGGTLKLTSKVFKASVNKTVLFEWILIPAAGAAKRRRRRPPRSTHKHFLTHYISRKEGFPRRCAVFRRSAAVHIIYTSF